VSAAFGGGFSFQGCLGTYTVSTKAYIYAAQTLVVANCSVSSFGYIEALNLSIISHGQLTIENTSLTVLNDTLYLFDTSVLDVYGVFVSPSSFIIRNSNVTFRQDARVVRCPNRMIAASSLLDMRTGATMPPICIVSFVELSSFSTLNLLDGLSTYDFANASFADSALTLGATNRLQLTYSVLNGASVTLDGYLLTNGSLTLSAGRICGAGNISVFGNASFTTDLAKDICVLHLWNYGSLIFPQVSRLSVSGTTTVWNFGSARIRFGNDVVLDGPSTGPIIQNFGLLDFEEPGGSAKVDVAFVANAGSRYLLDYSAVEFGRYVDFKVALNQSFGSLTYSGGGYFRATAADVLALSLFNSTLRFLGDKSLFKFDTGYNVHVIGELVFQCVEFSSTSDIYSEGKTRALAGTINFGDFRSAELSDVVMLGSLYFVGGQAKIIGEVTVQGTLEVGSDTNVASLEFVAGGLMRRNELTIIVKRLGTLSFNCDTVRKLVEVPDVSVEGTLNFNAGENVQVSRLTLNRGVIVCDQDMFVLNSFSWVDGTLLGSGSTISSGILNFTTDGIKFLDTRILVNNNNATVTGQPDFRFRRGARLLNNGTFSILSPFVLQSSSSLSYVENSPSGVFFITPGANSVFLCQSEFRNYGTVRLGEGALSFVGGRGAFYQYAGSFQLNGGTLIVPSNVNGTAQAILFGGHLVSPGLIIGDLLNDHGIVDLLSLIEIRGNYKQNFHGDISITINDRVVFGQLNVTGTTDLAGSLLANVYNLTFVSENRNTDYGFFFYNHLIGDFRRISGCNGYLTARRDPSPYMISIIEDIEIGLFYVSPFGSDASCCGSLGTPCRSIGFAVDAVLPGGTIFLLQGTFFRGQPNPNIEIRPGSKSFHVTSDPLSPAILDCQGTGPFFFFDQPSNVSLANFTVTHCQSDSGGAFQITSGASPAFVSMTFQENNASRGAVAHVSNAYSSWTDCKFSHNTADLGGALFVTTHATVEVIGSILVNQTARMVGGHVYATDDSKFSARHSLFTNSSSKTAGGMLYCLAAECELHAVRSSFHRSMDGGAIAVVDSVLRVASSDFFSNFALGAELVDGLPISGGASVSVLRSAISVTSTSFTLERSDYGGSVFIHDCASSLTLSFDNASFVNNTAIEGPAMYVTSAVAQVNNSYFLSNAASLTGGAISVVSGTVHVYRTVFRFNHAGLQGGAFHSLEGINVILDSSIFDSNTASSGGAVAMFASQLSSNASTFVANRVSLEGGAMYLGTVNAHVTNGTFESNECTSRGGAVFVASDADVTFSGCAFRRNVAPRNGGGFFSSASTLSVYDSHFSNQESTFGAAGYAVSTVMTVYRTSFFNLSVASQGGSIFLIASEAVVSKSLFERSSSGESGGGFHAISSTFLVETSQFVDCTSSTGGAVFVDSSECTFSASTMTSNEAVDGGGLFSVLSTVTLDGCHFANNSVTNKGGGLFCLSSKRMLIQNSTLDGNSATASGGGLYMEKCPAVLISDVLTGCRAPVGGGLHIIYGSSGRVINSSFNANHASTGAGVFCEACDLLSVSGSVFGSNRASDKGGALAATSSGAPLVVLNTEFLGNFAFKQGGALFVSSTDLTVENGSFVHQTAGEGGGLYFTVLQASAITAHVRRSQFRENVAFYGCGGGLCWDNVEPVLDQWTLSSFARNEAVYGADRGSVPKNISTISHVNAPQRSGEPFTEDVVVDVLDYYGQRVITDNGTVISVEPEVVTTVLTGSRTIPTQFGRAIFSKIGVVATPGTEIGLRFTQPSLASDSAAVTVVQCWAGETVVDRICKDCPAETYNLNGDLMCRKCPPEGAVCPGGNVTKSMKDYWLWRLYPATVVAYRCPENYCLKDNLCAINRIQEPTNILCSRCVENHVNWGSECIECTEINVGLCAAVFIFGWIYVIVLLIVGQSSSGAFKIFMYFAQTLQLILPSSLRNNFVDFIGIANFRVQDSASGSCIAPLSFFEKSLTNILVPFFLLFLLCLTFGLNNLWLRIERRVLHIVKLTRLVIYYRSYAAATSHIWRDQTEHERSLTAEKRLEIQEELALSRRKRFALYVYTFTFLLLFSYSTITLTVLEYLNCRQVENLSLVASQPEVSCTSQQYKTWYLLYIVLLIVVVAGSPFILLGVLIRYHRQGRLSDDMFALHFGVLYSSYRIRYFWYESLFMVRRTLIISIFVAFYDAPATRQIALCLASILILVLHITIRPFLFVRDNIAETVSLLVLGLVSAMAASEWLINDRDTAVVLVLILVLLPILVWVILGIWMGVLYVHAFLRKRKGLPLDEALYSPRMQGMGNKVPQYVYLPATSSQFGTLPVQAPPAAGQKMQAPVDAQAPAITIGAAARGLDSNDMMEYSNPVFRCGIQTLAPHGSGIASRSDRDYRAAAALAPQYNRRRFGLFQNPLFGQQAAIAAGTDDSWAPPVFSKVPSSGVYTPQPKSSDQDIVLSPTTIPLSLSATASSPRPFVPLVPLSGGPSMQMVPPGTPAFALHNNNLARLPALTSDRSKLIPSASPAVLPFSSKNGAQPFEYVSHVNGLHGVANDDNLPRMSAVINDNSAEVNSNPMPALHLPPRPTYIVPKTLDDLAQLPSQPHAVGSPLLAPKIVHPTSTSSYSLPAATSALSSLARPYASRTLGFHANLLHGRAIADLDDGPITYSSGSEGGSSSGSARSSFSGGSKSGPPSRTSFAVSDSTVTQPSLVSADTRAVSSVSVMPSSPFVSSPPPLPSSPPPLPSSFVPSSSPADAAHPAISPAQMVRNAVGDPVTVLPSHAYSIKDRTAVPVGSHSFAPSTTQLGYFHNHASSSLREIDEVPVMFSGQSRRQTSAYQQRRQQLGVPVSNVDAHLPVGAPSTLQPVRNYVQHSTPVSAVDRQAALYYNPAHGVALEEIDDAVVAPRVTGSRTVRRGRQDSVARAPLRDPLAPATSDPQYFANSSFGRNVDIDTYSMNSSDGSELSDIDVSDIEVDEPRSVR
jgi:hypothetical protein